MSKLSKVPKLTPGMVVVTPALLKDITPNKKYIVEELQEGFVIVRNDRGKLASFSAYQFIAADLYFTMCLFSTLITLYRLGNKAYK